MNISLLEATILSGGIFGFGLSGVLLLTNKYKCLANRLLGAFILCFSLNIVLNIIDIQSETSEYDHWFMFIGVFPLIYGPLLYLYAQALSKAQARQPLVRWLHFLPALAWFGLLSIALIMGVTSERDLPQGSLLLLVVAIFQILIPAQFIAYLALTLNRIRDYHLWLLDNFSDIDKLKISWLSRFILAIIGLFLLWLLAFGADIQMLNLQRSTQALEIFWLLLSLFVYWVGIYSLLHPEILSLPPQPTESGGVPLVVDVTDVCQTLEHHMKANRPFIAPNLTIKALAQQLELNEKVVSRAINLGFKQNFYDYINQYRIEEVKHTLRNPDNRRLKLEGIAYDCGIKSLSTFNRLFKKYVNETPTEYRVRHLT